LAPLLRHRGVAPPPCHLIRPTVDATAEEQRLAAFLMGAFDCEVPLVPKIALKPLLSVLGDHRNEEGAVVDLLPDLLIPRVPAPQLALIEKDLDAGRTQCLANLLRSLRIL
jgi:hypothetical protein